MTAIAALAFGLGGCAGKMRELMPTPDLDRVPGGRPIFGEVAPKRQASTLDLLFITDRAPETAAAKGPEKGLPYGEQRSSSLAFGSATVRLLPAMTWDELKAQSLS